MTSRFRNLVLLFLAVSALSFGQTDRRSSPPHVRGSAVSFEAIPFFSSDTAKAGVQIQYRIDPNFFVILRNPDSQSGSPYMGKGELVVELKDKNDNSIAREFRSITLRRSSQGKDESRSPDIQGTFALLVPPGTYTVWFNLDDVQSERSFLHNTQKVTTRSPLSGDLDVSAPLFAVPAGGTGGPPVFEALNHGTEVLFGERGGLLFQVVIPPGDQFPLTVQYKLSNRMEYKTLAPQEFEGDSLLLLEGTTSLEPRPDETINAATIPLRYGVRNAQTQDKVVFVPIPFEKLYPGTVSLSMDFYLGSRKKHFDYSFRVTWDERPLALANLEFAVEALRHIASEEEMETFTTVSSSRYVEAFFRFWKKRDPDTTTAYNELMTEYYRRVDIAIQRYSRNRENDGYKSDQGRIFILYGSPSNTERLFSPSVPPREVWTYQQIRKRFVFEDKNRAGVYLLIGVEDL